MVPNDDCHVCYYLSGGILIFTNVYFSDYQAICLLACLGKIHNIHAWWCSVYAISSMCRAIKLLPVAYCPVLGGMLKLRCPSKPLGIDLIIPVFTPRYWSTLPNIYSCQQAQQREVLKHPQVDYNHETCLLLLSIAHAFLFLGMKIIAITSLS
jgi:hypothetical protein